MSGLEYVLEYVGVRPCGCVTAWLSGKHATAPEIHRFHRDMAASGREVRRMLADEAGARLTLDCPHAGQSKQAAA